MDQNFLQFLMTLPPDQLSAMFEPYQQEQNVLEQQMALGGQMQQPGPQHSTPWGALLGGMSDVIGKGAGAYQQGKALDGQMALGGKMKAGATSTVEAMLEALKKRQAEQSMLDNFSISPASML